MPETWTGDIVAKMHVNCISREQLANRMGITKTYLGMVLNGTHKSPKNMEIRLHDAIDGILHERTSDAESHI